MGVQSQFNENKLTHALHSVFSFSGASRWFEDACPASIRMTRNLPDTTSDAAELGTAAHELGEFCIKYGIQPKDCIGMVFGKYTSTGNDIVVDLPMTEAVTMYVVYANDLKVRTGQTPQLEIRVVMTSLGRDDVYGTSDFILIDYANRIVYVSDYKHGYGLVDVINNKQLIAYGIATLDTLNIWQMIDTVVCTIIQPRVQHSQGCIRSVTYTTAELVEWQKRFANSIQLAEDPTSKPKAGEHCLWCKRTRCRARFEYILDLAYKDAPEDELTTPELHEIYANLNVMKRFMTAVEGEVLDIARKTGQVPEGYKPVRSINHAKVEDEKGLIEELKSVNINPDTVYEKKLISKTKAKAAKIPLKILNKYFLVPPSTIAVAKLNDNRPAIRVGSAEGVFQPINKPTNVEGVFAPIK